MKFGAGESLWTIRKIWWLNARKPKLRGLKLHIDSSTRAKKATKLITYECLSDSFNKDHRSKTQLFETQKLNCSRESSDKIVCPKLLHSRNNYKFHIFDHLIKVYEIKTLT